MTGVILCALSILSCFRCLRSYYEILVCVCFFFSVGLPTHFINHIIPIFTRVSLHTMHKRCTAQQATARCKYLDSFQFYIRRFDRQLHKFSEYHFNASLSAHFTGFTFSLVYFVHLCVCVGLVLEYMQLRYVI